MQVEAATNTIVDTYPRPGAGHVPAVRFDRLPSALRAWRVANSRNTGRGTDDTTIMGEIDLSGLI
jgi:hypothetical protein